VYRVYNVSFQSMNNIFLFTGQELLNEKIEWRCIRFTATKCQSSNNFMLNICLWLFRCAVFFISFNLLCLCICYSWRTSASPVSYRCSLRIKMSIINQTGSVPPQKQFCLLHICCTSRLVYARALPICRILFKNSRLRTFFLTSWAVAQTLR